MATRCGFSGRSGVNRALLLPLLLVLIGATPATAEPPALESVTVEARMAAEGLVTVSMVYFLRPGGTTIVPFGSIRFGDARVANVRAYVGAREVSFRIAGSEPERVDGSVELTSSTASTDRVRVRLDYEVHPAPDVASPPFDLVVPLLVAEWPPGDGTAGTLQASLELPNGLQVHAAFPSELEPIDSVDRTSTTVFYGFSLPVVPALIRARVGAGPPPLLTAERAIDASAIGLLALLAWMGWRRLRGGLS